MNPFLFNETARRQKIGGGPKLQLPFNIEVKPFRDGVKILIGIACAFIGLEGFILPNHLIDGGVTGISLLVSTTTGLPLGILIFLINLPFIYLGYRTLGQWFAIKTLLAISGLALALVLIDIPPITNDKLLTPVFGGAFLGAGIGFAIRGGAVIDGTEVLAVQLSKKLSAGIGDLVLLINIIIFTAAALLLNLEAALYSVLTYLSASKVVDFITVGIEEYISINILSSNSELIRKELTEGLGHGVTVMKAKRGRNHRTPDEQKQDVLVCIVTRLELTRIKNLIRKCDPSAFVFTYSVNETMGGIIKPRPLHD